MKSIPFFNYPAMFQSSKQEYMTAIEEVLDRGAFILQRDIETFEHSLADYLGVKHAIGVANCTDGLTIAMRVAGIQPGDEVIFPSHTFVATAAAIHENGATPVPVECGMDHMLDPATIEAAITTKTRAIVPVQLNGRTCAMDVIQRIADKHGLMIVEDAAQALGSTFKGRKAGTFGRAAAFSFYPAKTLGCFGDGGAVVTNDDAVAEQVRLLRDHGRNAQGETVAWGMNSRLDNLQAVILNVNLQRYDEDVRRRRALASLYDAELRHVSGLQLPPAPDADPDHFDIYQNYEIEAENRDALQAHLREYGVGSLQPWGGTPVHGWKALGFQQRLPATERLFARVLMLPMNTTLTDDDVTYVCAMVKSYYGH